MADLVFSARGSSFVSRYSRGEKQGTSFNGPAVIADAGSISGSVYDMRDTTVASDVFFQGARNTSNTRSQSVLIRFAPDYTGAPVATRAIFSLSGVGNVAAFLEFKHTATTGTMVMSGRNELNAVTFGATSFGAWTAGVAGTYYDVVFTWDGTTTTDMANVYIDGTVMTPRTSAAAHTASWNNLYYTGIHLGISPNASVVSSAMKIDEFCIWDGIIDPTSVALESGTGSLNGASRTSHVAAPIYNGPAQYSRGRIVNR